MKKLENYYGTIFKNYCLTDLMIIKNGKRKGTGDNYGAFILTEEFLKDYGIRLFGAWTGLDGYVLRGTYLDKNFPEENFPILQQMYGFTNADIYVCLDRNEICEYGFYFNTETLKIRLVEYRWGDVKKERFFNSFTEFWAERKAAKRDYNKLLK